MERLQEFLISKPYIVVIAIAIVFFAILQFCAFRVRKRKRTALNRKRALRNCVSSEDLSFKADNYQNLLDEQFRNCRAMIRDAQKKGYIKASITWTKHFEEFSQVSNTLYRNLEYENSRQLNSSRFRRYTDLHFRSMLLDHLAYEDYIAAKKVRDEISELIVAIGKGTVRVPKSEKDELYKIKDVCVNTTKFLYERMINIQQETRQLKYKIRDECGQKGSAWFAKMEKNKLKYKRKN